MSTMSGVNLKPSFLDSFENLVYNLVKCDRNFVSIKTTMGICFRDDRDTNNALVWKIRTSKTCFQKINGTYYNGRHVKAGRLSIMKRPKTYLRRQLGCPLNYLVKLVACNNPPISC